MIALMYAKWVSTDGVGSQEHGAQSAPRRAIPTLMRRPALSVERRCLLARMILAVALPAGCESRAARPGTRVGSALWHVFIEPSTFPESTTDFGQSVSDVIAVPFAIWLG